MINVGTLSDFVFPRYFFTHESDLDDNQIQEYLSTPVLIHKTGQTNNVKIDGTNIVVHQPSSVSMFLFHLLHNLISKMGVSQDIIDNSTIATVILCNDYINADDRPFFAFENEIVKMRHVPELKIIIEDILEPLLGVMLTPNLCFVKSSILDVCKIAEDERTVHQYAPDMQIKPAQLPVILCNTAIKNKAALFAHIIELTIKASFGDDRHANIVKRILVSENGKILDYILETLKTFQDDPMFVLDFLRYTESSVVIDQSMMSEMNTIKARRIASDATLNQLHKNASSALMSTNHNQWTQMSLMVGLLEKQLDPARGSRWPATHKIKPVEDRLRAKMMEMKRERRKRNLNFEELLDARRSMYNHKAIEPSKVIEVYLKKNRDWH